MGGSHSTSDGAFPVDEIADLYAAWDRIAPGRGYDAKADEWRRRSQAKPPK
jgi:hypothetical protein